jgi:hypothetical protein
MSLLTVIFKNNLIKKAFHKKVLRRRQQSIKLSTLRKFLHSLEFDNNEPPTNSEEILNTWNFDPLCK